MQVTIIKRDGKMVQIQDEHGVLTVPRAQFDKAERIYLKNVRNSLLWAIGCFASLIFCEYLNLPHWTWMLNAIAGTLHFFSAMYGWKNSHSIVGRAFMRVYYDTQKGQPDAEV